MGFWVFFGLELNIGLTGRPPLHSVSVTRIRFLHLLMTSREPSTNGKLANKQRTLPMLMKYYKIKSYIFSSPTVRSDLKQNRNRIGYNRPTTFVDTNNNYATNKIQQLRAIVIKVLDLRKSYLVIQRQFRLLNFTGEI